jgi:hypothetical protein
VGNAWGSKEDRLAERLEVVMEIVSPIVCFIALAYLALFVFPQLIGLLRRDGTL